MINRSSRVVQRLLHTHKDGCYGEDGGGYVGMSVVKVPEIAGDDATLQGLPKPACEAQV